MSTSTLPADRISASDAARILGVSRQRVYQLGRERPDFPPSFRVPKRRNVYYSRAAVLEFAQIERLSGAPGHRWPAASASSSA